MTGQTIILWSDRSRVEAKRLIDMAPHNAIVNIKPPGRTIPQNDKMHAMLSDISRAKPMGRRHTPDVWKALMMKACGHQVQFEHGIDGEPFPVGFRSSRLTVGQMSDLIEFMYQFGAENGITWSDEVNDG